MENGDGCSDDCMTIETGWTCPTDGAACISDCGNGIMENDEECDDGNLVNYDGCDDSCFLEPEITAEESTWNIPNTTSIALSAATLTTVAGLTGVALLLVKKVLSSTPKIPKPKMEFKTPEVEDQSAVSLHEPVHAIE